MLYHVYESVCCQIVQLITLLVGNDKHFPLSQRPSGVFPCLFAGVYLHCKAGGTRTATVPLVVEDEGGLAHG